VNSLIQRGPTTFDQRAI